MSSPTLGKDCIIQDGCVLGILARDGKAHDCSIGDNALIRSGSIIYTGNIIGNGFQTGHHVVIREHNRIGHNVSIGTSSVIEHHVTIEDDVRIHSGAFIPEYSVLKKGCWIGPRAVLTNAKYPLERDVKDKLQGVTIGERAKIGANATLLPGISIGHDALIGAGSVVTKDVEAYAIVAGNPAKVIGSTKDVEGYA